MATMLIRMSVAASSPPRLPQFNHRIFIDQSISHNILIHLSTKTACCNLLAKGRFDSNRRPGLSTCRSNNNENSAFQDSLLMLDWNLLCSELSKFAMTAAGKRKTQNLYLSKSQEEAETLLLETTAALSVESIHGGSLDFVGIDTTKVEDALRALRKGIPIEGIQASAMAKILTGANGLRRSILNAMADGTEFEKKELCILGDIVRPMVTHPNVVKSIWAVVSEDGSVRDDASPELKRSKIQLRSMEMRVKAALSKFPGEICSIGGRLCVQVSAGNDPINGLLLLSSQGGAFSYIEPFQVVPLNNQLESVLAETAKLEEAVLISLGLQLREYIDDFQFVVNAVAKVDEIFARSRFSSWLGARQPSFVSMVEESSSNEVSPLRNAENKQDQVAYDPLVDLAGLRHPLLLVQHREKLKAAQSEQSSCLKRLKRARGRSYTEDLLSAAEQAFNDAENEVRRLESSVPVAIDVSISRSVHVVTITGPNTGGKTATIKSIGLALLMAKAGLFVVAMDALLPWVDSVLADIGDSQSLTSSLSTFSGHLERIQRIRNESTGQSLVLLDELGSGTAANQGAALGIAILESMAERKPGGSLLTMATTHHGELKALKYRDSRFENASVEFDEVRLAPTYRLLWGVPGRSNAINIAQRLGLPAGIVQEARRLHGTANAQVNTVLLEMESARVAHEEHCKAIQRCTEELAALDKQYQQLNERMREYRSRLALRRADIIAMAAEEAMSQLQSAFHKYRVNSSPKKARMEPSLPPSEKSLSNVHKAPSNILPIEDWLPSIGAAVTVSKLASDGVVTLVNFERKTVEVKCGLLKLNVKWSEVAPKQDVRASQNIKSTKSKKPRSKM